MVKLVNCLNVYAFIPVGRVYCRSMKRVFRLWKIIIFDIVGVSLMIAALLTGWLPGPGGIPLFIIGLSILAIHHDWAQDYIDKVKDIAENIGERIFVTNPKVQRAYDIAGPLLLAGGLQLIWLNNAIWQLSLGIFLAFMGVTVFLGNRKRFHRLKRYIKHKY